MIPAGCESSFNLYGLSYRINAYLLLVLTLALELDLTVNESKKCIVRSDSDIITGMDLCTTLSDKDVSGDNCLSVALLCTKSLGFGVTTVLGGTHSFLVSKEL